MRYIRFNKYLQNKQFFVTQIFINNKGINKTGVIMAIDNTVNLSQVANQYQKNDILTKPQKYQVNPNAVDKTPDKDTVQLSSGLTTKEKVGIAAVATTIVAGALAILGRNGHLGKSVQKFLGGKAKKAAQEMGEHTHTPNTHVEPKPTVKAEPEPNVKPEPEPNVKVEQEAKVKAEQEAKAKAEQEAKAKAEQEAKVKAEQEAKAKAEQEAKAKAEQEAKAKAEQEAKAKAEQEAKAKAEQEAKAKAEQEAKAKAEQEAKVKAEQEAKELRERQIAFEKEEDFAEAYVKENMEELDKLLVDKDGTICAGVKPSKLKDEEGENILEDVRYTFDDLFTESKENIGEIYHYTDEISKEKILSQGFSQRIAPKHGCLDGLGGTYFTLSKQSDVGYGATYIKAKFNGKVADIDPQLINDVKYYSADAIYNVLVKNGFEHKIASPISNVIARHYLQQKLLAKGYSGVYTKTHSAAGGCYYFSALDPSLIQIIK